VAAVLLTVAGNTFSLFRAVGETTGQYRADVTASLW
jgi:hypothetical protein